MAVIFWFRRDLRLNDNLGLGAAIKSGQPVIPLFIFDPAILNSDRLGIPRLKFMLKALESLNNTLNLYQRKLLIRYGNPLKILPEIISETGAQAVYFNQDYTPYARARDEAIQYAVDIPVHTFHDRLLVPPQEIAKDDGTPYTVYTPFMKKWRTFQKASSADYALSTDVLHDLAVLQNENIPSLADLNFDETIDVPEASEAHATSLLSYFLQHHVNDYAEARDLLGNAQQSPRTHTSFLSPYIRFGLIATRTIYWACRAAYDATTNETSRRSITKFVDELIWHEFYTYILWHFPDVKTQNFQRKYDGIQWQTEGLQAWKDGRTGYPIVDAAMRQLKATGWMHNRARMVVASFLTKDLLIDWREGELHFMKWLIDGDLAANNGGWQWAAGTGTDAQPYFRIFNPVLQSRKFDPNGEFIRCWIPELQDVPDQFIHEPWKMPHPPKDYPPPIVDHSQARQAALDAYKWGQDHA